MLRLRLRLVERLQEDIQTAFAKDPAARSPLEILLCYPGLHALWLHRLAHFLWRRRLKLLGRLLSHLNRFLTGVEIHPGARIGRRVFIDHGAGVVIGETAEVGDDVLLYQGVVLGGTSLSKGKRHPTVEDGVVIGAGAILLGPIRVGRGARIGAGAVVVKSVPPGATVVGNPGRVVRLRERVPELEHGRLPDPLAAQFERLLARQEELERRLAVLEERRGGEKKEEGGPLAEPELRRNRPGLQGAHAGSGLEFNDGAGI